MSRDERRLLARAYYLAGLFFAPGMDRDDLAQEALVGAVEARRDYRAGLGTFSAFERLCMRRRVLDAIKAARRAKHEPLNASVREPLVELEGVDELGPRIDLQAVLAALPSLTVRERFALGEHLNGRWDRSFDGALFRARRKLAA